MGSSDPLLAGFEIRFGSLNFQATGNGYLMRLTNRDELRARRQAGPSQSPPHAPPRHRHLPAWTLRVLRCHGAADAPASARDRRGRSADMLHESTRNATRPPARRQPRQRGSARSQDRTSLSVCTALRRRTLPLPMPMQRRVGLTLAALSRLPGIPAPPPATSHPKARPASCHPPLCTGTRSGISPVYPTQ
jgi:hypothetical protein